MLVIRAPGENASLRSGPRLIRMRPRSEPAMETTLQQQSPPQAGPQQRPSSYMVLLNSLASDLDLMLSDLCTTPPPPSEDPGGGGLGESEGSLEDVRGDAFLEPYMQGGLGPTPRESPLLQLDGADTEEEEEEGACSPPHAVLQHPSEPAVLAAKFRLIELRGATSPQDATTGQDTATASGVTTSDDDDDDAAADAEDEDEDEASGGASCSSGGGGSQAPCDIGLLERLIRSHPVWFLAGLQRAGAVHLLQGKEEGNFVVRQSSQADTMAISVRLPMGKGPYIEHYLVQASSSGQLALESSENRFDDIPTLVAHYAQCCDELPVQLTLPRAIKEAKNRQQLSSLALLGQEFWRYPMANPKPERGGPNSDLPPSAPQMAPPSLRPSPPPHPAPSEDDENNAQPKQQTPNSSHSSLSSFGSGSCSNNNLSNNNLNNILNNNSASSSSSPPTKDNIVLNLAPISPVSDHSPPSTNHSFLPRAARPNTLNLLHSSAVTQALVSSSPLSPNSAAIIKSNPPKPPPRWAKPSQNFTVTTTVTINVNQTPSPILSVPPTHMVEVQMAHQKPIDSPSIDPTTPLRPQPPLIVSPSESKLASTTSLQQHRRSKRKVSSTKESYHYQESDILDSPTVYYRSSVADKISDYEDIWGPSPPEHKVTSPQAPPPVTPELLTFKPRAPHGSGNVDSPMLGDDRRPDLLGSCASLLGRNAPITSPLTSPVSPLQLESPVSSPQEEGMKPAGSPFYAEPADAIRLQQVQRRRPRAVGGVLPQRQRILASHRHSDPTIQNTWWPPAGQAGRHHQQLERIDSSEEIHAAASVDNITMLRSPTSNPTTPLSAVSHQHPLMTSPTSPLTPTTASALPTRLLSGVSESQLAIKRQQPKGKPVQPPRVLGKVKGIGKAGDGSWAVDSSWEFFGSQAGSPAGDSTADEPVSGRFPSLTYDEDYEEEDTVPHLDSDGKLTRRRHRKRPLTAQELIAETCPELGIPPDCSLPGLLSPGVNDSHSHSQTASLHSEPCRISSYDNVEGLMNNGHYLKSAGSSSQVSDEDTHTVFSEPWDSSRWETLLLQKGVQQREDREDGFNETSQTSATSSLVRLSGEPLIADEEDETMLQADKLQDTRNSPLSRTKSFRDRMDPLLSPPRLQALRCRDGGSTGATIRAYALQLAADKTTTFAQNIENFICCTRESKERSPHVAMRNMRQFMSGMKNYLVKHGERGFEKEVEKERLKLKANEFLNLDAILEGVMHKLVVRPLREHLYNLFVSEYTRTGAIQLLASNIQYARTKPAHELGIRSKICPPSERSLHTICHYLTRLQQVDSPLEKLENLLACISSIFNSVKSSNQGRGGVLLGADDFLPLFVWVLVRSGMVAAEIEAEFMWGLLQPSLLSGEGGYYLTTLSSAVHVLKNFRACSETENNPSLDWRGGSLAELRSVLRIVVPDELHGSILTKTLPVRPNTTTRDVCKIIAHKIRITNPQDYGLYKLVDGEETLLNEGECPQDVKDIVSKAGKHCVFAYKRIDAKIAWPRTSPSPIP